MEFINGINEVANPLLVIVPIALMILSGYPVGRTVSKLIGNNNTFFRDLLYGNVTLNFIFILGFLVLGFLVSSAKLYFTYFTFALIILSIVSVCIIFKTKIITYSNITLSLRQHQSKLILFGTALLGTVLVYHGILIYYHPIFLEYDSLYLFLLISKSILLGNGLADDFYIGSDIALKIPPFTQAINAWLIHSFGYSAMRLFPIYFVFLSSLFVYSFARNITKDTSLGIIASTFFLITPALLIISSHFSLQQDIPFIFLLGATFYFVSEIIGREKPSSILFLMLMICLSLLSLTREIGIVVSVAIFFLIPALKFTRDNIVFRGILTVLSLLPLYFLTFYDILANGMSNSMAIRLVSLLLANSAIFYISLKMKNQNQFKFLKPNMKFLVIITVPLIFFASNVITIGGPFATIIFSSQFGESVLLHREVFETSQKLSLIDTLRLNLPRADIFMVAVSLGSIFVFLRLKGFIYVIENFGNNVQYPLILALSITLLVVWSYLLESGFELGRIRHIAYFLPIASTLIVLAAKRNRIGDKLFYYCVIVFSTYYFLNYDLYDWHYFGQFGGFYIEPYRSSTMNLTDFIPAAAVILVLIIYESKGEKLFRYFRSRYYLARYSNFVFMALLGIQVFSLSSSGISLSALSEYDQVPPPEWEKNVFEIIDFLRDEEEGKVLSLRAPAISFFTNRTNFDLYNPHAFSYIYHLLFAQNNVTQFKQKISDLDIKYLVFPNERSSLYPLMENLKRSSMIPQLIEADEDFQRINFKDFSVYKFNPLTYHRLNLIEQNKTWNSFGPFTQVSTVNGTLSVKVLSTIDDELYNRAYMQTQLNSSLMKHPLLLSLNYASESSSRIPAIFLAEIRDQNQKQIWSAVLSNTNGTLTAETFALPKNILDVPLEFRMYIITEGIGRHSLTIPKANILFG